jgi:hypothetical protein
MHPFGHKFEGRYDQEPSHLIAGAKVEGPRLSEVIDAFRKRTYVRDVCVRCGETIERGK